MVYDTDFPFSEERDMNYNNGNVGVNMARVSFLCSKLHAPNTGQEGGMGPERYFCETFTLFLVRE
jgi:hypothetical protein